MKNIAVILLAGDSTRFKSDSPKQLFEVNGKPLFYYSVKPFVESKHIDSVLVVSKKEYFGDIKKYFNEVTTIEGGASRHESVKKAISYLKDKVDDNDNVLIHDGARLFLDDEHILKLIEALKDNQAATLALPSEDTLGVIEDGKIVQIPDRSRYVKIQTPQAFKFMTILRAHQVDAFSASDDAQLCLGMNVKVAYVEGSKKFNKVTTIEDIKMVEGYLKEQK
ncbi:MAG: 2-C-methyl-D-erythritol 4-phosphate cytidylyltransferase [Bacilli bacterium]|nr:2-C-methyl-D-erythritol 4-phosphate cytidylyltransferase [Bacilli bacterium]